MAGYRIVRPDPRSWEDEDIRFDVPIYTMEAARYLELRPNTFASRMHRLPLNCADC